MPRGSRTADRNCSRVLRFGANSSAPAKLRPAGAVENANSFKLPACWQVFRTAGPYRAGTLTPMRMADADDLVAVDVFNAAQATGEPVTTALVRRVVDDLLTHPPECGCGRCEAAATARVGDVRNIASSWQRAVAATKTTRDPLNRQRVGSEVHLLNNHL